MEQMPSLSEQTFKKSGTTAEPIITTQPTAGAGRSFIHGVSMPANANAAHQPGASRLRGGGAAKDCCVGILAGFVCCECCEGMCDCVSDVLCCPCEMMGC